MQAIPISPALVVNFGKIEGSPGTDFKALKKLVDHVDTYLSYKYENNLGLTLANRSQLRSSLTICLNNYD